MKVLIKDLSDRRAEADGVILIFLVDADLDVDCGACTGLQSAADKPARLTGLVKSDRRIQIMGLSQVCSLAAIYPIICTTKHFVTAYLNHK